MELTGIDELMAEFEQMGDKVKRVESKALREGGEVIKKYQEANWNRSTKSHDHITDNIVVGNAREVESGRQVNVAPRRDLIWRAYFIEYGTSHIAPQAPIERSGQQGQAEASERMMKVFESVIK